MAEENVQSSEEQHAFQAEIRQLLHILARSLYTGREIFLRELISNASDALNRIQFEMLTNREVLDSDAELAIRLNVDKDAGALTVSDTGVGMTREELIENLGVIAHSGVQAFMEQLKKTREGEGGPSAGDIIGQFGVGFYSVFMVADEVTVVSRSHRKDAPAWAWVSRGSDTYTLRPAEKATRGTDITLKLKDDAKEFLEPWKLREVVRTHSDYVAFPIYLDGDAINQRTALWRRPARDLADEDYTAFYRQFTLEAEPPLLRVHMSADAPLQFYALLFIPASPERGFLSPRRERGLKLYARKVLIQDYCTDLLPEYLNFVHGVVDSEDLPLNVSRESFQANREMARLKHTLTHKVLSELAEIADKDPERYATIWRKFGPFLKQGVAIAPGDRAALLPLLRFYSSRAVGAEREADKLTSLAGYVARFAKKQREIYYVLGDDLASVARSPHLDPFRQRGIEVLYLVDPIDSFMVMGVPEYEGFRLRNIDDAGLDLSDVGEPVPAATEAEPLPEGDFEAVRARFAKTLGERVLEVRASRVLTDSPGRLVSPEDAPGRDVHRVYRLLEHDYEAPKKIMELNPRHAIIRNLAAMLNATPDAPLIDTVVEQLYESALLIDGLHPDPARMVPRLQALMEAATARVAPPAEG